MEKMFLGKLEAGKKEFEEFKIAARENEKQIHSEVKTVKSEKAEMARQLEEQQNKAQEEL